MVMYNLQAASSPVEVSAQVCVAKNLLKSPHFPSMSPPPSSDLLLDECNGADLGGALPTGSTSSLFRPFHFPSFPSPPPSSSSILHPLASAKMKNCLSQETRFILWFYSISRNTRRTWDSFVILSQSTEEWKWHISPKHAGFSAFLCGPPPPPFFSLLNLYFHGKHEVMALRMIQIAFQKKRKKLKVHYSSPPTDTHTLKHSDICVHSHTPLFPRLRQIPKLEENMEMVQFKQSSLVHHSSLECHYRCLSSFSMIF